MEKLEFPDWKAKLVIILEDEIALNSGFKLFQFDSVRLPIQRADVDYKEIKKKQRVATGRMIRELRVFCKRFKFDPGNKKHREIYQYEEGEHIWKPRIGDLDSCTAMAFYDLYAHLERKNKELSLESRSVTKRKRRRLPKSIAQHLLAFLELNKGDKPLLLKLRGYLAKELKRDLEKIKVALAESLKENCPNQQLPIIVPPSILNLTQNRGSDSISHWSAQWRNDLHRVVASEGKRTISKKIGRKIKQETLKKLSVV